MDHRSARDPPGERTSVGVYTSRVDTPEHEGTSSGYNGMLQQYHQEFTEVTTHDDDWTVPEGLITDIEHPQSPTGVMELRFQDTNDEQVKCSMRMIGI